MRRKAFIRYSVLTTGLAVLKNNRILALAYSAAKKKFINKVNFIWSGAITPNSARVNAKLETPTSTARLVVSTDVNLTNPTFGAFATANLSTNNLGHLVINNLLPDTQYYYGVEADGHIDMLSNAQGRFRTSKAEPYSFSFTVGSCIGNANHPVFSKIAEKNPLFHIIHGDFHYHDPNSAIDINVHRLPYENRLVQPGLRTLLQSTPLVYMWDDHDFSGDDSWTHSAGKTNARLAYQEYVPHYPLQAGSGDVPIYHSFTAGRIRFIISDLRSERYSDSMMGTVQKQWFKNECLAAKNNSQAIIWISSVPWSSNSGDSWLAYANERKEISDFWKANNIKNLCIICGDAHMIAIDNGNSNDFSTGGNNPNKYPIMQAGALSGGGSNKGGIFSEGIFPNPDATYGQYGAVHITDNGGVLSFSLIGYRVDGGGVETILATHNFSFATHSALPTKILAFNAVIVQDNKIAISWKVDNSTTCKNYTVERSENATDFYSIHSIDCRATGGVQENVYIDDPLSKNNYYRLKVTEDNGGVIYSSIKGVRLQEKATIQVINNPANNILSVRINTSRSEYAKYSIEDNYGRVVLQNMIMLNKGSNLVNLTILTLSAGLHFYTIHLNGSTFNTKFIKN